MTPLQSYMMRTASAHQNVHLYYFVDEEGMGMTDLMAKDEM